MINPIQGSKFPQVAMHIDSLLLPKSKTSNTYSPASPPDLLIPTSHPPQNGWALCGLLMPKDKLPLTYFTTGKGNPVETEAGKYKIFKMSIKKKKYFDFIRIILKSLEKINAFTKCVQSAQQTSRFHLIQNAFIVIVTFIFFLCPTPSTYERNCWRSCCTPPAPSLQEKSLSRKTKWWSGGDKGRRRDF